MTHVYKRLTSSLKPMTTCERRALRLYPHYFRNRRPRTRYGARNTRQLNHTMTRLLRDIGGGS